MWEGYITVDKRHQKTAWVSCFFMGKTSGCDDCCGGSEDGDYGGRPAVTVLSRVADAMHVDRKKAGVLPAAHCRAATGRYAHRWRREARCIRTTRDRRRRFRGVLRNGIRHEFHDVAHFHRRLVIPGKDSLSDWARRGEHIGVGACGFGEHAAGESSGPIGVNRFKHPA